MSKKKVSQRRTKYVAWFNNHVSRKDDEWVCVWAKNHDEAREKGLAKMNSNRFSLGGVYTIKQAREIYGQGFPF